MLQNQADQILLYGKTKNNGNRFGAGNKNSFVTGGDYSLHDVFDFFDRPDRFRDHVPPGRRLRGSPRHNFGNTPISLAGFEFDRGIQFQFPADAEIQAKGYTVIAGSPDRIRADHLISDVSGPYTGRLSNSGERLRLIDAQSNTVFSFRYRDHGDWPAAADGTGHSLILDGNKTDPDNPRNWSASRFIGGSPGGIDEL